MARGQLGIERAERVARDVLGSSLVAIEHHPVGFGNQNWILADSDGRRYVLKVAGHDNEPKWHSSHRAYRLAADAGLPVPALVHVGRLDEFVVRVFTWIEGHSGRDVTDDPQRADRFLRTVGAAVRVLHGIRFEAFSSRLDGSAPSFAAWKDYISYRLAQIRARCQATQAADDRLVDEVCAAAGDLAAQVNRSAQAVLCHRDLHPANLIVADDGTLVGIVDWDGAEAWDRAGDWFKLEFDLLRLHPGGEDVLVGSYLDGAPVPHDWKLRRDLVHLIEALNILPNAVTAGWDSSFADRAREDLLATLAETR